jgi:hypothetical protein
VKTDVRSANNCVGATDGHELLGGPLVGIAPIRVRYRVSSLMAVAHSCNSLVVYTVRGRPAFIHAVGATLPVSFDHN